MCSVPNRAVKTSLIKFEFRMVNRQNNLSVSSDGMLKKYNPVILVNTPGS